MVDVLTAARTVSRATLLPGMVIQADPHAVFINLNNTLQAILIENGATNWSTASVWVLP